MGDLGDALQQGQQVVLIGDCAPGGHQHLPDHVRGEFVLGGAGDDDVGCLNDTGIVGSGRRYRFAGARVAVIRESSLFHDMPGQGVGSMT
ncbi:hypothetical protein TUM20983_36800 [Mycobacterium antarcticum]|nr:hypothetical protein TUM20983_36800 [Mycolicibacterium sp. TUM20983]